MSETVLRTTCFNIKELFTRSIWNCNFAVIFCGCETLPLTMGEERMLSVFENMVLRRIFGPKKYEVTTEAYGLYSSPNIFRMI